MPVLALVSQGTAEAQALSGKRRTASGGSVIDSEAMAHLLQRRADSALTGLTSREHDILFLTAQGRSNRPHRRAAVPLPETAETHIAAIFTTLGLLPASDDHRRAPLITYLKNTSPLPTPGNMTIVGERLGPNQVLRKAPYVIPADGHPCSCHWAWLQRARPGLRRYPAPTK